MANINDLQKIAETVRALINQVGQQLSSIFGRLAITGNRIIFFIFMIYP